MSKKFFETQFEIGDEIEIYNKKGKIIAFEYYFKSYPVIWYLVDFGDDEKDMVQETTILENIEFKRQEELKKKQYNTNP